MTLPEGGPPPEDRGALMRHWLLRFFEERPFRPFAIRLEGGFEIRVPTAEVFEVGRGVLVASVYQDPDHFETFPIDRIVSLKLLSNSSS